MMVLTNAINRIVVVALVVAVLLTFRGLARALTYETIRDIDGVVIEGFGSVDGQSCLKDLRERQQRKWVVEAALDEGCKAKFGTKAVAVKKTAKPCGAYLQPHKAYNGNGPGYDCAAPVCGLCQH